MLTGNLLLDAEPVTESRLLTCSWSAAKERAPG
jgi:hypothetical protein